MMNMNIALAILAVGCLGASLTMRKEKAVVLELFYFLLAVSFGMACFIINP
jgi:hypothetical protein